MKVVLASPTYGMREPKCSAALMVALMTAARHGTEWLGVICPDRMSFADARNHVAEFFMDHLVDEADGIVWVDSDIKPEADSIRRLLATTEQHGFDFLSGIYHARNGEHRPVFYHMDDAGKFRQNIMYEDGTLKPEGACGFGFVYTSKALLVAISKLPNFSRERGQSYFRYGDTSEDLHFCTQAHMAGVQLYVDTGIQVAHLGDVSFVTKETYLQALAARTGGVLPVETGV